MRKFLLFVPVLFLMLLASCSSDSSSGDGSQLPPPITPQGVYYISKITDSQFTQADTTTVETTFTYEDGRLDEVLSPGLRMKFEYLSSTKVQSVDYYLDAALLYKYEFHYNGNLLDEIARYSTGYTVKTAFTYDNAGTLSSIAYKKLVNNGWVTVRESVLSYDDNVNEVLDTYFASGGVQTQAKTVYAYEGNNAPFRFMNQYLKLHFMDYAGILPLNVGNMSSEKTFAPTDAEEPTVAYTYANSYDSNSRASVIRKKDTANFVVSELKFEYIAP